MLNVTHTYLDTGSMNVFYTPYVYGENGIEKSSAIGERWILVTKELCGIDSPDLPRYFPVTLKLCVDSEKMKKYFLNKKFFLSNKMSDDQKLSYFYKWENDTKPILLWLNDNVVSKSAKDGVVASLFQSS